MELQIYQTDITYDNVAPNRGNIDVTTANEMLLGRLAQGIATFVFTKKDGTARVAIGTLSQTHIPPHKKFSEAGKLAMEMVMEVNRTEETKRGKKLMSRVAECGGQVRELLKPNPPKNWSSETQPFFDLQAMEWKSFRKDNLVAVIDL